MENSPQTTTNSGNHSAAGSPPDHQGHTNVSTSGMTTSKKGGSLPKLRGHIELIIGPMFAGKSTELMRRMKRHEVAGNKCLKIKFSEDTRYSSDSIATHDK